MSAAYCTIAIVMSGTVRPGPNVNYQPAAVARSPIERIMGVFNAMTTVFFAYGGHNVALEIQATIPSKSKTPNMYSSTVPAMMRGVNVTFVITGKRKMVCMRPGGRPTNVLYHHQIDMHPGQAARILPQSIMIGTLCVCVTGPLSAGTRSATRWQHRSDQPCVLRVTVQAYAILEYRFSASSPSVLLSARMCYWPLRTGPSIGWWRWQTLWLSFMWQQHIR
jgi:hypothetical protein